LFALSKTRTISPTGVDLVYHNVSDLEAGHLVFDRDHQFETIEQSAPRSSPSRDSSVNL